MIARLWPVLRWLILNFAMFGFLFAGMVYDVTGARYVGLFQMWVCIVLSPTLLSKDMLKALSERKDWPSVPPWLGLFYDIIVITLIVWFGWFVTASFYLIQTFLCQYAFVEVASMRKAKDKEVNSV